MTNKWRNIKDNDVLNIGDLLKSKEHMETKGNHAVIIKKDLETINIKIIAPKTQGFRFSLDFYENNYYMHDIKDYWQILEE